jgi:hypothetical protein
MNFPNPDDDSEDNEDDLYDAESSSNNNNNGGIEKSAIDAKRKNGKKKTSGTGTSTNATTSGKAASAGRNNDTLHEIEKMKKCQTCGNNDQSSFILDLKNGDVICSNCGTVVSESIMHEGSQYVWFFILLFCFWSRRLMRSSFSLTLISLLL